MQVDITSYNVNLKFKSNFPHKLANGVLIFSASTLQYTISEQTSFNLSLQVWIAVSRLKRSRLLRLANTPPFVSQL